MISFCSVVNSYWNESDAWELAEGNDDGSKDDEVEQDERELDERELDDELGISISFQDRGKAGLNNSPVGVGQACMRDLKNLRQTSLARSSSSCGVRLALFS
jgi:hypothetical protein